MSKIELEKSIVYADQHFSTTKKIPYISPIYPPPASAIMNGVEKSSDEKTRGIPMRRVVVQDPSHMPSHYSETPGGTLFSTTPGGEMQILFNCYVIF